jgi:hypothetical protein
MNKFWQLAVPLVLTQRYSNGVHRNPDTVNAGTNTIKATDKHAYKINIEVNIDSISKINFLQSPSHSVKANISEDKL